MAENLHSEGGGRFPATRWSVVVAARSSDASERSSAQDLLFRAYWKPIYKYIRLRWNRPAPDAQDLTQGFFIETLERDLLARYDPGKSRLRTYLRLCVDSFVLNETKAAARQKRGGTTVHVALDFAAAEEKLDGLAMDPGRLASPESLEEFFLKEWVRNLFMLAVLELKALASERGKERAFELFEDYDLDGEDHTSYAELAAAHEIPVTEVTNSLAWARREFRRIALLKLRAICGSEEEFRREARAVFGRDLP